MTQKTVSSPAITIKRFFRTNLSLLQLLGWVLIFLAWYFITNYGLINTHVLPTPQKTLNAFKELSRNDDLGKNILFSVRINLMGYLKCIVGAIIFGFAIGLNPKVRKMFSHQVSALRF